MEDVCDFIKNFLPISIVLSFPFMFIILPTLTYGAHDFPVYRMHQINLYSVSKGCHGTSFSLEAKNLKTWVSARHCVIVHLKDLTSDAFLSVTQNAGALLIILPNEMNVLQNNELTRMIEVEKLMLNSDVSIPVYFIRWENDLQTVLNDMEVLSSSSNEKPTTLNVIYNSIFAMGYHITVRAPRSDIIPLAPIPVIQGKLSGIGEGRKKPVIVLVAHYDSYSVVPELSFGADSNGSGVAALFEIARVLSKLYSNRKTHSPYDIVFILSGGGKLNFLGSKKWLEHQINPSSNIDEKSLVSLKNVAFVICLDSLTAQRNLHLHVSKPPKVGTPIASFVHELNRTAHGKIKLVHKKINLADRNLAWEHERFSIKRLPSFTLSALSSHKDWRRSTMFDVRNTVDDKVLYENVSYLLQTLVKFIYNRTDVDSLIDINVQQDSLQAWLDQIATHPRYMQLLADKQNPLVKLFYNSISSYVPVSNVTYMAADKQEPEFEFYDVTIGYAQIYNVKPAIFDLVLTIVIGAYLSVIYLCIQNFSLFYSLMTTLCLNNKKKVS